MEKKHITSGTITIDIKEYRELVEAATRGEDFERKYYEVKYALDAKEKANG